jgi:predicted dehydrogenase
MHMIEAAKRRGVLLTVSLSNRWHPSWISVREAVRAGEIAEAIMAYARTSDMIWVPTKLLSWVDRSGPQWFLFAHSMDMLRWIVGQEATEAYAVGVKQVLAARNRRLGRDPGGRPLRASVRTVRDVVFPL